MALSTVIWFGTIRLFQLYYAIKYDICINTWDPQKVNYERKKEYQCPLLGRAYEESICIKINYENEQIMKLDKLETVKKALNMTSAEIKQICKSCEQYPFKQE